MILFCLILLFYFSCSSKAFTSYVTCGLLIVLACLEFGLLTRSIRLFFIFLPFFIGFWIIMYCIMLDVYFVVA